jgi:AraC-like DNA-binding protein
VAKPTIGGTKTFEKIVFSSEELPAELDDRARYSLWQDLYTARYGSLALSRSADRPFSMRFEFAPFGNIGVGRFAGTVTGAARSTRAAAAQGSDDFCLTVNSGRNPMVALARGREATLASGAAALFSDTEAGELRGGAENAVQAVVLPRRPLLERVAGAEDAVAIAVDAAQPAARLLSRYLAILTGPEWIGDDPVLVEHIATTLLDLIGLALGAGRDAAEVARGRGLRAARLLETIAEIRMHFADPAFSPDAIALKFGVTPRYVQKLLSESGASFTGRVLELRLQKARAMLGNPRYDRMRVSEIAYSCGFSDSSYFNRTFRARFGASPLQYRGGKGAHP